MNPSTTSSIASLGNIGRWAVAPLLIPFDSGFPTHTQVGRGKEGGNKDSQPQPTTEKRGKQQRQNRQGEHTTSKQRAKARKRGEGGGRQHTEPNLGRQKTTEAGQQREGTKALLKKGREGTGWVGGEAGEEREGKKRTGKESVRTAPIGLTWRSGRCTHLYSCIQGRTEEGGKKGNARPGPHTRSMRVLLRLMATSPMRVLRP